MKSFLTSLRTSSELVVATHRRCARSNCANRAERGRTVPTARWSPHKQICFPSAPEHAEHRPCALGVQERAPLQSTSSHGSDLESRPGLHFAAIGVHAHAAGCNWRAAKCRSASCAKPTRPSRITTGSPALTVGLNEASKRLQHLRSTWPSCKALFQLQLLPNCAAQFAQFAKCKITLCQPETRAWSCLEACSQQSSARTSTPNLKFSKVSHIGSTNKVVASQPERTVRAVRAVRPCAATVSRHDRL